MKAAHVLRFPFFNVAQQATRFFALLLLGVLLLPAADAAPPERFAVEDVLTELEQPMSLRFLPDGRLLVLQKKGIIRIVDTSTTPATSAVYLNLADPAHPHGIKADQERGLIDIALDPNFPTQPYIYLFYTPNTGPNGQRARIGRFTHRPNSGGLTSRGDPASEVILWEDTHGYDSCCHFGGGLDFGPDGKLWLTIGDHFQGSYAASLSHAGGGVIRINKDGTIPADNPYVDGTGPNHDALFAHGLRNPFRARWDLPTGRLFIGEVGGNEQPKAWEDLHVIEYDPATGRFIDDDFGTATDNNKFDGINFGWPTVEGLPPYTDFPGATIDRVGEPLFAYPHLGNTAAINGGIVYRGTLFPAEFRGAYFYADSTRDFVRYLKFNADGSVAPNPNPAPISIKNPDAISHDFDSQPLGRIVALEVGPDGALYFVSFTDQGGAYGVPNPSVLGAVRRYVYDAGDARPEVTRFEAQPPTGPSPHAVQFTLSARDPEGLAMTYVVDFGDGVTSAPQTLASEAEVTFAHTYASDGVYEARLEISDGTTTTVQTTTIKVGTPPVITSITGKNSRATGSNTSFRYGDTFTFSAAATDAEDGTLNGSSFTWSVSFVRPGNVHPAYGPETGTTSIVFPIPAQGQGFSGNVFYRASLTVTDSSGLTTQTHYDIYPEKANITLQTQPAGIMVQIDGNTEKAAPYVHDTLINFEHTISVPQRVCVQGIEYRFAAWSNGPTTAQQVYVVPPSDTTLTATYTAVGECVGPPADGLVFHLKSDAGVVASGGTVLAWEDQSTLGNHLSALGAPSLVSSGGPNNQSFVHFDGVDDALRRAGFAGLPTGATDRSVFMVVRYNAADASTGGWAGFSYGANTNNGTFGLALTPEGYLGVQGWGRGNDIVASPAQLSTGTWLTQGAIYRNGVLTQYRNGSAAGSTTRSYATGTQSVWLGEEQGGGKNLNMDVAEILVYARALSDAERERITTYFQDRYVGAPPANAAPSVTITQPEDQAILQASAMPITLTGIATDTEDGNIGAQIQWSSNLDGALGSGSQRTVTLSTGTHTLSARVVDSANAEATDEIVVTVQASDPVPPTELVTEGLVLHLEADLNVSMGTGSTVAGWLDQSGLGNDLVSQGGPQFVTAATPTGRPAIRLDGNDDRLERVQATDALGGLPAGNANRTMFMVARYTSTKAWGGAAYGRGANNETFGLSVRHPTGQLVLHGWGSGNDLVSATPGLGAGWLVQGGLLENSVGTLFKDGQQIAQFSHAYNTVLERLVIGREISGAGYVGLDVAAILVYDRALSAAERSAVHAYLRGKYIQGTGPSVTITAPTDGSGFTAGSTVTFNATASDPEDGNLGASVQWTSSLNGALGQGTSISTSSLAPGTHTITATVSDTNGHTATHQITISIGANSPPTVSISAPAPGASYVAGNSITFTASASDPQDGDLTSSLSWTSNLDGALGTGGSITRSNLSVGTHTITAETRDAANAVGSAQISITVTAPTSGVPVSSGLVLHLEATDGVAVSNGSVTSWSDRSPRGNHLTAAGGPLLISGATPSGRPALRLDGVDDRLDRTHATSPLNGLPTGNGNRTLIVLARYLSTTWWGGVAYGQADNNRTFGVGVKHPSGELFLQGFGKGYDLVSTSAGVGAGWLTQTGILENGTVRLLKNGNTVAQKTQTFATTLTRLVIGQEIANAGHIGMEVAAVLLYDRALTATELSQVHSYLQSRYLSSAPANTAPQVVITAPANNSTYTAGTGITFTATANDAEDGSLASTIAWTSSRDGALGTGASISRSTLTVGTHTITAKATDSGGLSGQAQITVTITQPPPTNTAPSVTITAPANNSSFASGSSITFTATASDTQDGNLASAVAWTSSRDGALGTGASISRGTLTVGTHTITAKATDSGGLSGQAQITVTITQAQQLPVTTGLVLHLDSLQGVTASGGIVSGWSDLSGRDNHVFAQGQPTLNATATPSGKPAIRTDTGHYLERVHATHPLSGLPTSNANRTIIVVGRYHSTTWWSGVAYGTAADNRTFGVGVKHPSGELFLQGYGSRNDLVSTTPGVGAGWLVQSAIHNNSVSTLFHEAAAIAQFNHTFATTLNRLSLGRELGGLGYATMDIAAVLIYNRALTPTEHATLVSYLRQRYLQ